MRASVPVATSRAATRVDYTIGVLGKAMDLLDVLAAHEVLSLTELSKRAGVHKVTAFRILTNFEERGYVEREPATGHYRLGFRLMELGMRVTERLDLRTVARPILTALRAEVGETVNLAVPGSNGIVYIDILQSTYELRMAARVGAQDDYHATALGKAMIAFWPASGVAQLLRRGRLRAKTARTITTAKALQRELELTRERGYSVDDEENEVGARCIGAPVFDQSGAVVAAISVAGPVSRLAAETLPALAERVLQAGRQISHRLGYRDSGSDE